MNAKLRKDASDFTRRDALSALRREFAAAAIDNAALDARVLVQAALGIDAAALAAHPNDVVDDIGAARIAAFAARRLAREPVARILRRREFWGMSFALSPATLIPRSESETIVTTVVERLRESGRIDGSLSILDLGAGTGCLLVALLVELPNAIGLGVDRSPDAIATARDNAAANGVGGRACFAVSDWAGAVAASFDIVVANPPYVATAVIDTLAPEVSAYDPRPALDGGTDGLDAYRAIVRDLDRLVAPGGLVALEVGAGQADEVRALLAARGLANACVVHDLSGMERVVAATR